MPTVLIVDDDVLFRHALRETFENAGTEITPLRFMALRAGYLQSTVANGTSSGFASLGGLGGGFGLKFSSYQLDYVFTPFGELGNTQRLSFGAKF